MKKKSSIKEKKFFLKPEFKTLQEEWYAKLADEGFVDTETIKDIRTNSVNQQVFTVNEQWVVYYDKCTAFLRSGALTDELEVFILEQHILGKSNHKIASMLAPNGHNELTSRTIDRKLIAILDRAEIEHIVFKV